MSTSSSTDELGLFPQTIASTDRLLVTIMRRVAGPELGGSLRALHFADRLLGGFMGVLAMEGEEPQLLRSASPVRWIFPAPWYDDDDEPVEGRRASMRSRPSAAPTVPARRQAIQAPTPIQAKEEPPRVAPQLRAVTTPAERGAVISAPMVVPQERPAREAGEGRGPLASSPAPVPPQGQAQQDPRMAQAPIEAQAAQTSVSAQIHIEGPTEAAPGTASASHVVAASALPPEEVPGSGLAQDAPADREEASAGRVEAEGLAESGPRPATSMPEGVARTSASPPSPRVPDAPTDLAPGAPAQAGPVRAPAAEPGHAPRTPIQRSGAAGTEEEEALAPSTERSGAPPSGDVHERARFSATGQRDAHADPEQRAIDLIGPLPARPQRPGMPARTALGRAYGHLRFADAQISGRREIALAGPASAAADAMGEPEAVPGARVAMPMVSLPDGSADRPLAGRAQPHAPPASQAVQRAAAEPAPMQTAPTRPLDAPAAPPTAAPASSAPAEINLSHLRTEPARPAPIGAAPIVRPPTSSPGSEGAREHSGASTGVIAASEGVVAAAEGVIGAPSDPSEGGVPPSLIGKKEPQYIAPRTLQAQAAPSAPSPPLGAAPAPSPAFPTSLLFDSGLPFVAQRARGPLTGTLREQMVAMPLQVESTFSAGLSAPAVEPTPGPVSRGTVPRTLVAMPMLTAAWHPSDRFVQRLPGWQAGRDAQPLPVPTYRPFAARFESGRAGPASAPASWPGLSITEGLPPLAAKASEAVPAGFAGPSPAPMPLVTASTAGSAPSRQAVQARADHPGTGSAPPAPSRSPAAAPTQRTAAEQSAALTSPADHVGTWPAVSTPLVQMAKQGAAPPTATAPGQHLYNEIFISQLNRSRPGSMGASAERFGSVIGTRAAGLSAQYLAPELLVALSGGEVSPAQAAMLSGGMTSGERVFLPLLRQLLGPVALPELPGQELPAFGPVPLVVPELPTRQVAPGHGVQLSAVKPPQAAPTLARPAEGAAASAEDRVLLAQRRAMDSSVPAPRAAAQTAQVSDAPALSALALPWTVLSLFPASVRTLLGASAHAPASDRFEGLAGAPRTLLDLGGAEPPRAGAGRPQPAPRGAAVPVVASLLGRSLASGFGVDLMLAPRLLQLTAADAALGSLGAITASAPASMPLILELLLGTTPPQAREAARAASLTLGPGPGREVIGAERAPSPRQIQAGPMLAQGALPPSLTYLLSQVVHGHGPLASDSGAAPGTVQSPRAQLEPGPGAAAISQIMPLLDGWLTERQARPQALVAAIQQRTESPGAIAPTVMGPLQMLAQREHPLTQLSHMTAWQPPPLVRMAEQGAAQSEKGVPMWAAMPALQMDVVEQASLHERAAGADDAESGRAPARLRPARPLLSAIPGGRASRTERPASIMAQLAGAPAWQRQTPEATLVAPVLSSAPPPPSEDPSAKLLDAVRAHAKAQATASDDRITLGDLTLIAIAAGQQQMAAASHGSSPGAIPVDNPDQGKNQPKHSMEDHKRMHHQVIHLVRQILDEIEYRESIADERHGEQ